MVDTVTAPQVFLSYAGSERSRAMAVRAELTSRGIDVIMDDEFEPGRSVMVNIGRALHRATVVLALVSSQYLDRHFTEIEVSTTLANRDSNLIPIVIGADPEPETDAGKDLLRVIKGRTYFRLEMTPSSFDKLVSAIRENYRYPERQQAEVQVDSISSADFTVVYDWEDSHLVDTAHERLVKLGIDDVKYYSAGVARSAGGEHGALAVLWTSAARESPEIAQVLRNAVTRGRSVIYLTLANGHPPPAGARVLELNGAVTSGPARHRRPQHRQPRRRFDAAVDTDLTERSLRLNDGTPFHLLADKFCLDRAAARAAEEAYRFAVYEMPPMHEHRLATVLAYAAVRRFVGDWTTALEVLTAEPLTEMIGQETSATLAISLDLLSLEFELGRVYGAVGRGETILAKCLAASDWPMIICTHRLLGMIHKEQGRYSSAREHLQRAAHYSEDLRDTALLKSRIPSSGARRMLHADCLRELATLERRAGNLDSAQRVLNRALDETRPVNMRSAGYLTSVIEYQLARVNYAIDHDYESAKDILQSSYRKLQQYDNPIRLAGVLESIVRLEMDFSSHSDTQVGMLRPTLRKVLRVGERRGHDYMIARVTAGMGDLEYSLGNSPEAMDRYEFAQREFNRLGKVPEAANSARLVARCLAHIGDLDGAMRLLNETLGSLGDNDHKVAQAAIRAEMAHLTHNMVLPNQIDDDIEMTGVGEFSVHNWIAHGLISRHRMNSDNIVLSVGDDAAILRVSPTEDFAVSTDSVPPALLRTSDLESAHYAARFAVVSSLSDIIAMGGEPLGILLNLHLQRTTAASWTRALLQAVATEAAKFGAAVIGGDLKERPGDSLTTTVVGKIPRGGALRRSGARVGDAVVLTLSAGADGVVNGLGTRWAHELLPHLSERMKAATRPLVDRNAKFNDLGLAVDIMRQIANRNIATAAIDTSDGLLACAQLVGEASGVGLEIDVSRLDRLINDDVRRLAAELGIAPFLFAMNAGHDWEVLVTVQPEKTAEFEALAAPKSAGEYPSAAVIGRVVSRGEWSHDGIRLIANDGGAHILPFFTDEKFVAHPYELRARDWLEFARDATRQIMNKSAGSAER
ncbi:AIR synthase related protein [Nocardia kruczakiae]|uniref:AIR synthase related protein n=1 Tax=Nocardia kruczakiae TaxID=261477 RepID=UPI000A0307B3|nr:AIR synthase related protein [Nocardia kruczakiae]